MSVEEPKEKRCKECQRMLPIDSFEPNQHNKNNVVVRRSVCKECRRKAKKFPTAPTRKIREFERLNPRPKIGLPFTCPICERTMIVESNREVNLDHNHDTGDVRGWVCNDCNTGMGKFKDNITRLNRAIQWLKGTLHLLSIVK